MSTKDQLLRLLEENCEQFVSGEALAQKIGVGRNSVWKAVATLRAEGYDIAAVTNRGYCLSQESDLLSPASIERHLPAGHPFRISVRKSLDSTNAEARRRALEGATEGTVIIAEEQTAGRGRRGKTFFSPAGSGIYLSIVLRPELAADRAQYLTCAAAVACARAIEQICNKKALIKWVNDIYCDGRKVAGILTEGSVDMEGGGLEYAVLGIGINVREPADGFPDELAERAGSVCGTEPGAVRSALAAEVLAQFWQLYENVFDRKFYEDYQRRCFLIGQHIVVSLGTRRVRARAIGLTDDFKLIIQLPDGTTRELPYGEVQ